MIELEADETRVNSLYNVISKRGGTPQIASAGGLVVVRRVRVFGHEGPAFLDESTGSVTTKHLYEWLYTEVEQ